MNVWLQPWMWSGAFLLWYQIFHVNFISFLSRFPDVWMVPIVSIYIVLWCLSLGSLYKSLFVRIPLHPGRFHVPNTVLALAEEVEEQTSDDDSEEEVEIPRVQEFYKSLKRFGEKLRVRKKRATCRGKTVEIPTVCFRCRILKPLRTYHCPRCGICVPRLDHHCPALGKCIHIGNHKHFLLFLAYAVLICTFTDLVAGPRIIAVAMRVMAAGDDTLFMHFTFAITGILQTTLFPVVLIWFQWSLWLGLFNDDTTVGDGTCASDESALVNVAKVFGSDRRLWALPLDSLDVNGYFQQFYKL